MRDIIPHLPDPTQGVSISHLRTIFEETHRTSNIKKVTCHKNKIPGSESGRRGSVWAETRTEWILRPPGSFLDTSRAQKPTQQIKHISKTPDPPPRAADMLSLSYRLTAGSIASNRLTPISWGRDYGIKSDRMNPTPPRELFRYLPGPKTHSKNHKYIKSFRSTSLGGRYVRTPHSYRL